MARATMTEVALTHAVMFLGEKRWPEDFQQIVKSPWGKLLLRPGPREVYVTNYGQGQVEGITAVSINGVDYDVSLTISLDPDAKLEYPHRQLVTYSNYQRKWVPGEAQKPVTDAARDVILHDIPQFVKDWATTVPDQLAFMFWGEAYHLYTLATSTAREITEAEAKLAALRTEYGKREKALGNFFGRNYQQSFGE